jgi:glutaredoxin
MATGNIAQNCITGKFIKTAPPTQAYRDGWDNIFKAKTYVLATASFCGPCIHIKNYLESQNLNIAIKDMAENPDYFKQNNIKTVPCLTVFKGEELIEHIYGQSRIMTFLHSNFK